jgi:hypothetical protein
MPQRYPSCSCLVLRERPLREATIRAVVARFPADPDLQQSILWAIGELRITDRLALDLLIECLNSDSERNRLDAMTPRFIPSRWTRIGKSRDSRGR